MVSENQKGTTAAFGTLTPFRDKLSEVVYEGLALFRARFLQEQEPVIRDLTFLHHALWVKVPKSKLRYRSAPKDAPEREPSLVFLSYFTGDLLDYLRGFTERLAPAMNALWGPCKEWEGAESYGATKRFVLNHRWRTDAYFNGRTDLNVGDTRVALATALKLDELADTLDEWNSDAAFAWRYDAAARTMLGKEVRFSGDGVGEREDA